MRHPSLGADLGLAVATTFVVAFCRGATTLVLFANAWNLVGIVGIVSGLGLGRASTWCLVHWEWKHVEHNGWVDPQIIKSLSSGNDPSGLCLRLGTNSAIFTHAARSVQRTCSIVGCRKPGGAGI